MDLFGAESFVWAVELSNGEVGRGDAGPGKVRQYRIGLFGSFWRVKVWPVWAVMDCSGAFRHGTVWKGSHGLSSFGSVWPG